LSEEKKAFLLKGVHKGNSEGCQGCDKNLGQQIGARKNGKKTGVMEKEVNSVGKGKQLTGNRQVIQSLSVHWPTKSGLFFLLLVGLIALFANLVLLGSFFAA